MLTLFDILKLKLLLPFIHVYSNNTFFKQNPISIKRFIISYNINETPVGNLQQRKLIVF